MKTCITMILLQYLLDELPEDVAGQADILRVIHVEDTTRVHTKQALWRWCRPGWYSPGHTWGWYYRGAYQTSSLKMMQARLIFSGSYMLMILQGYIPDELPEDVTGQANILRVIQYTGTCRWYYMGAYLTSSLKMLQARLTFSGSYMWMCEVGMVVPL